MSLFIITLSALYFMLPAYVANMAPVFCKKLNFLNIPVDSGKKIMGKEIFGSHKTWRGIVCATFFGIIVAATQKILYSLNLFHDVAIVDYGNWLILGFLLGFGAIIGDLAKSFIKRRIGIASGKPFLFFDQMDYIIGALIFSSFLYTPQLSIILIILILSPILTIIVNFIAYKFRIRNEWL